MLKRRPGTPYKRTSATAAISVALTMAVPVLPALAQAMPGPRVMHDFGWWPLGGLLWLLVLGLAIVGIVAIIRWLLGQTERSGPSSGALKVLDDRYARGEIDREEYLQRRKDIAGG